MQRVLILKANLNGDIRKVPLNNINTVKDLEKKLCLLFSLGEDSSLTLKYKDEEGDWISVCSDEDLKEAQLCCKNRVLELKVVLIQKSLLDDFKDLGENLGNSLENSISKFSESKCPLSGIITPIQSFFSSLIEFSSEQKEALFKPKQVQHICKGCQKVIVGNRYHCLQCQDFDFCGACALEKMEEHHQTHVFKQFLSDSHPIINQDNKEQEAFVKIYHDAFCSVCDEKIEGIRWKCFDCNDFDFCDSCYEKHKGETIKDHLPSHEFARMEDPQKYFTFLQQREEYFQKKKETCSSSLEKNNTEKLPKESPKKEQQETSEEDRKEIERVKTVIKEKIKQEKEKQVSKESQKPVPETLNLKPETIVNEKPQQQVSTQLSGVPQGGERIVYPFEQKLQLLHSMGFTDSKQNIQVLLKHKGDIEKTIDQLLS